MNNAGLAAGSALQAVFAARGCDLTTEEARRLAETMIDLVSRGLIVPVDEAAPPTRPPEGD